MSEVISAFLALVLSLTLGFGNHGSTNAINKIQENAEVETKEDSVLKNNFGLQNAEQIRLMVQNRTQSEVSPTPSPSITPTFTSSPSLGEQTQTQNENGQNEEDVEENEQNHGLSVSLVADSDEKAEIDESENDNAVENHGQAVQEVARLKTNLYISTKAAEKANALSEL